MAAAEDKITLYVSAKLIRNLKTHAHVQSVSTSQLGEELLEDGIKRKIHGTGMVALLPGLEKMVEAQLTEAVERIVRLQVRETLDAGQYRSIPLKPLSQLRIDRKTIASLDNATYQDTACELRRPLGDQQEIVNAANDEGSRSCSQNMRIMK